MDAYAALREVRDVRAPFNSGLNKTPSMPSQGPITGRSAARIGAHLLAGALGRHGGEACGSDGRNPLECEFDVRYKPLVVSPQVPRASGTCSPQEQDLGTTRAAPGVRWAHDSEMHELRAKRRSGAWEKRPAALGRFARYHHTPAPASPGAASEPCKRAINGARRNHGHIAHQKRAHRRCQH